MAQGVAPQGRPAVRRRGYTVEQVRDLSRAAEGHRLAGVFAVILLGLRRSEVLGLVWSDVDLEAGALTVSGGRVWIGGGYNDDDPKTSRGARTVALDTVTVERLRAMRKAHAVERLAVGVGLGPDDVLASPRGRVPHPARVSDGGVAATLPAGRRAICPRSHDVRRASRAGEDAACCGSS